MAATWRIVVAELTGISEVDTPPSDQSPQNRIIAALAGTVPVPSPPLLHARPHAISQRNFRPRLETPTQ
jgi:hypothetical protein